jgi:hypothetical protein
VGIKQKFMTVQAQEIIEYRGKNYSLLGYPLNQLLKDRTDIVFDTYSYSTAHSHGYQGYWKLEDNKLYITNLDSSNYQYKDIFQTEKPTFADWFSGEIKFGFGNYRPDHWWGNYDDYLLLNISQGIVLERKIIKLFCENQVLTFGKYKNRKFEEVLHGKIYWNVYPTLKAFLEDLIHFICDKEFEYKVQSPYFKIEEEDIELVKEISTHGMDFFLTQKYIAFSNRLFWDDKEKRADKTSKLLEKILSSDFLVTTTLFKKGLNKAETSENTILINSDLDYLIWALKTVESFSVPPTFLNQNFKLMRLKTLKINRINSAIFEYKPIMEDFEYKFPDDIIKINQKKFEDKHSLNFNTEGNFYTYKLSEDDMMIKFGFYLDESYDPEFESYADLFRSSSGEGYSRKSYGNYAGSYAQDIEGLSDDYIDNVFGGDEDAYWNID